MRRIFFVLMCLFSVSAFALTPVQLAAVKTYINSDNSLYTKPNTNTGNGEIAIALNSPASPMFYVWRTLVTTAEVGKAVNYVAVEAMTDANRARITTFYTMNPVNFEPRSDIRTYWDNTFSGALGGQGQATRDALAALWKRGASVLEKVLATGTGSSASPAVTGYEGTITADEVEQARSLP